MLKNFLTLETHVTYKEFDVKLLGKCTKLKKNIDKHQLRFQQHLPWVIESMYIMSRMGPTT